MGAARVKVLRKDKPEAIDQTRIPADDAGLVTDLIGELANRLADVKGGANPDWKPNAAAKLADLRAHLDAVADNPHGTIAAQTGGVTKAADSGIGPLELAANGANPLSLVTKRQVLLRDGSQTLDGRIRATYADPDAPLTPDEIVTRAYVDLMLQGLTVKQSVRLATNVPRDLAAGGLVVVDGVQTNAGDRILLFGQTALTENGVYVAAVGAWVRADDANASRELPPGSLFHVNEGTANGDSAFALVADPPITLGTTALSFTKMYGPGSVIAGSGLARSGNTLSVGSLAITAAMIANNSLDATKFVLYQASPLRPGTMPKLRVATLAERDALTNLRNGQGVFVAADQQDYTVTSPDGSGPSTGAVPSTFKNAGSSSSLASQTTSGTVKTSAAAADPVAVVTADPDWTRVKAQGYFAIKATAYVFNGVLAASTTVVSGDLRGLWGIPADAVGVWVTGNGFAVSTGNFRLLFDAAGVVVSEFSPRWAYTSTSNTGFTLPVLLGTGVDAGKIQFVSGGSALGTTTVPFQVYVLGYWR